MTSDAKSRIAVGYHVVKIIVISVREPDSTAISAKER
jgi:hypothetical protein